jgi:hypothetical protein
MKGKEMRFLKGVKILLFMIVACFVFGFVTLHLWNWLMPAIFGLRVITFWQALGLVVLSKILFGGFHKHGGGRGRGWKRHMEARWAGMSDEEREKFREGMRGRCGRGFGRGGRGGFGGRYEPTKVPVEKGAV